MTCIVGYIDKDRVYIGADSAGTDSNHNVTIRKDAKVFRVNEFLIGGTTSFRMLQILRYRLKLPPFKEDQDVFEYMCTSFIDAVRECFITNKFVDKEDNNSCGIFLVAVRGRLFRIDADYHVSESMDQYESCGSGEQYAKGAMRTILSLKPELPATRKIELCLDSASYFNGAVAAPYVIESI